MRRRAALVTGAILALSFAGVSLAGRGALQRATPPAVPVPSVATIPAGPLVVGILGTSLSHGEAWPDTLAERLSGCRSAPVSAEIVASPGANSSWGVRAAGALLGRGIGLLLVEFSINDASLLRGVSVSRSLDNHRRILAQAAELRVPVVLLTTSGALARERVERPGLDAYRSAYRDLAQANGAGLIDLAPLWDALASEAAREAMPDGLHPTAAAFSGIALPHLEAAIRPAVCNGRSAAAGSDGYRSTGGKAP